MPNEPPERRTTDFALLRRGGRRPDRRAAPGRVRGMPRTLRVAAARAQRGGYAAHSGNGSGVRRTGLAAAGAPDSRAAPLVVPDADLALGGHRDRKSTR